MTSKRNPRVGPATLVFLLLVVLLIAGPFAVAVYGAFVPNAVFTGGQPFSLSSLGLENFENAFRTAPLLQQLLNSALVTIAQTLLQFVTSLLAAYAIVFSGWRRSGWILSLFLVVLMIPSESTIIANYLTIRELGLFDTLIAVFLPFGTSVWAIFLFHQAFKAFPAEIREAAQLDGCGPLRFLVGFLLPLHTPIAMTVLLTSAIAAWNGYMWPLLVTESPETRTVQVGVASLADAASVDLGLVLAGLVVVSIPMLILTFIGQKFLVRGLTQGAVK